MLRIRLDGWQRLQGASVAKDYKRIGEGNTGLNTGGMGAVSRFLSLMRSLWRRWTSVLSVLP